MGPPPAPKKSGGVLKYVLGGCGCVVLLGICVSLGVYFGLQSAFGVEHTRYPVTAGQPYSFQFQTSGDGEHVVWIDYDLSHTSPWMLTGNISVATAAGVPLKSVQLTMSAEGAPTSEGGSRMNMNSTSTNVNGNGSASGVTRLFAIPAQPNGTTLIVSGTVIPSAGTTLTTGAMVIRR